MTPHTPQTLLAFDVGTKRTGVAVGQSLTETAQAAGYLEVKNGKFDWLALDRLIDKWQPNACVVGNPQTDDPHLNKVINRLSHYLRTKQLQVHSIDERLTSEAANSRLKKHDLSLDKKIKLRDQVAACIILERYFDSLPPAE